MIITAYWFSIIHDNTEEILQALTNGSEHRRNVESNLFLNEPKTILCIFWGVVKQNKEKQMSGNCIV